MSFSSGVGTASFDVIVEAVVNRATERSLRNGLRRLEGSVEAAGKKMKAALGKALKAGAVAGVAGMTAAAAGIGKSVAAAADFGEIKNKSQQVFGDAQKDIEKFASDAAKNLNISKAAAMDSAAGFGLFAGSLKGEELAKFSTDLVKLQGDLSSFYNMDANEVKESLEGALRGSTETLTKFGIVMNQNDLQKAALQKGYIKNLKEQISSEKKALLLKDVIMDRTKEAQGDVQRSAGSVAFAQRRIRAQFEDMQLELGSKVLPIVEKVMTAFALKGVPAIKRFGQELGQRLTPHFDRLKELWAELQPKLINAWPRIRDAVKSLGGPLKEIGQTIARVFRQAFPTVKRVFADIATTTRESLLPAIKTILGNLGKALKKVFSPKNIAAFLVVLRGAGAAFRVLGKVVKVLAGPVSKIALAFAGFAIAVVVIAKIVAIFKKLWAVIKVVITVFKVLRFLVMLNPFGALVAGITLAIAGFTLLYKNNPKFRAWANRIGSLIKDKVVRGFKIAMRWARQAGAFLVRKFQQIYTQSKPALSALRRHLVAGFKRMQTSFRTLSRVGKVVFDALKRVFGIFVASIRLRIRIAKAIFKTLQRVWQVVSSAIKKAINSLRSSFSNLANRIRSIVNQIRGRFDALRSGVQSRIDSVKKLFRSMGDAFGRVRDRVGNMVESIKRKMTGLRDAAAKPIRWVVNVAFSKLASGFNTISGVFNGPKVSVPRFADGTPGVQYVPEFGGWRGSRSDHVPALLTPGEAVIGNRAKERLEAQYGKDAVGKLVRGIPLHGDPQRFADGGIVRGLAFAKRQLGKPYLWAGVGPNSYDCSGLVGTILNVMAGKANPYSRLFATGYTPPSFIPGSNGIVRIGIDRAGEKGRSIGHTAMSIGGLSFESRGGGVGVIGPGRARHPSSFNHQYTWGGSLNLPKGFSLASFTNAMKSPVEFLSRKIDGLVGKLDSSPLGRVLERGIKKLASLGGEKLKTLGGGVFDEGGIIHPGTQLVTNLSRKPERILTHTQNANIEKIANSSGTQPLIGTVNVTESDNGSKVASEILAAMRTEQLAGGI